MYSVGSACRGLRMHEVENLSGEMGSSVPRTLQQTQTQEGKGQRTVTWALRSFFGDGG